jgi:hypothetical protein
LNPRLFVFAQDLIEKGKAGELKVNKEANGDAAKDAKKRKRWDQAKGTDDDAAKVKKKTGSSWEDTEVATPSHTPSSARWDETPGRAKMEAMTPGHIATPGQSQRQWEATPSHTPGGATPGHETPGAMTPGRGATPSNRRNRWDETPKTDR